MRQICGRDIMTDRGKTVYPLQKQQRALNSAYHTKHIRRRQTGATSGAGTAYPSGEPEFTAGF